MVVLLTFQLFRTIAQLPIVRAARTHLFHSLRAQADKNRYHLEMKKTIEQQEGLDLKQGEVMVADFGLASMKKQAMKRSAKTVLLADSTKLSQAAPCTYASVTAFDAVYINGNGKQKYPKNFITVEEKKR